jgi:hypothetical protein
LPLNQEKALIIERSWAPKGDHLKKNAMTVAGTEVIVELWCGGGRYGRGCVMLVDIWLGHESTWRRCSKRAKSLEIEWNLNIFLVLGFEFSALFCEVIISNET